MTRRFACPPILLGTILALLGWITAPALAAPSAGPPQWVITAVAGPSYFKPNSSEDLYVVSATNVGGEATSGEITIEDSLEGEVEATSVLGGGRVFGILGDAFTRRPLTCPGLSTSSAKCVYQDRVDVGDILTLAVKVKVTASQVGKQITNTATVSGGAPASATTTTRTEVSSKPVPFGLASLFTAASTAQAGAHPNFTTSFTPNYGEVRNTPLPVTAPREIAVNLPPGLSGDPLAVPRCDIGSLRRQLCPLDTAVGVANIRIEGENLFTPLVYNITPYPDEPAAFAFTADRGLASGRIDTSVIPNAKGEYVVHASVSEINDSEPLLSSSVTLWGTPSLHNGPGEDQSTECAFGPCLTFGGPGGVEREGEVTENSRIVTGLSSTTGISTGSLVRGAKIAPATVVSNVIGEHEVELSNAVEGTGGATVKENLIFPAAEPKAFMRNPTSCAGPLAVGFEIDSWEKPKSWVLASSPFATPEKCDRALSELFTPSLAITPDTTQAGAPSGYGVNLEVPQNESSKNLATPDLKDSSVTLPEGTVASPSAANGLEACSDAQFDKSSVEEAHCPPASEIGKVRIKTPLLESEVTGQLFVGQPECSPCGPSEAAEGKMLRLFLQAQLAEPQVPPQDVSVRIKLAGRTHVKEQNGQLTSVFENNPQQPFEKLTLHTDGGAGAPLANPSTCGPAKTTSKLVPWSSTPAEPFEPEPESTFQVTGCGAPQFAPAFNAGMTSTASAGAYSPLSVTFSRTDQDQIFSGITTQMPPGLLAAVSHVTQCGEPQASQGACGPESQIGTVASAAGPGPTPFWVTNGRAYLTGPYKGGPFGLSIVVPTKAGPFDLGDEHLRAAIYVDPYTSATTVVSDPLPTIKDGIPFQVRTVNVNINRPQFTLNATNCKPMAVGATISSTQNTVARVSSPYQAHGCASLPFSPEFTAEAGGHGSRANGTSFIVKVKATPGDANIAKTFLALPLALSSRLSTIQKACLAATFEANPASCPEGSNIGMAVAHTPLLKSPLVGPAYLVSHGNAAFPDVEFVLQGEGITLILDGKTDIKKGITYSRFETVPDAPVSTFETVLPAGPHSALTPNVPEKENYSLCNSSLVIPTEITGQNGAVIKKITNVALIGCAAAKPTVKIARVKLRGTALLVTVRTGAAGTVRISGRGLKTTTKAVAAGTHQIRVALTRAGRSMRKHHKKTTVHVSLTVGKQADAKATAVRL